MKFLHTADWHIGKKLHNFDLKYEEDDAFKQIERIAEEEKVDAIIIAGDLYDRSLPSEEAVKSVNKKLKRLNLVDKHPLLIISGNHDSATRLNTGSEWFKATNLFLNTKISGAFEPVEIEDTQFFLLPYFEPQEVRNYFDRQDLKNVQEAMQLIVEKIKEKFKPNMKHVLVAHFFANGSTQTDSETNVMVGGLDAIPTSYLNDFDYVALGHLHDARASQAEIIKYSGSPVKFSVSEATSQKGVWIVDTEKISPKFVPLVPVHEINVLEDSFDNLISPSVYEKYSKEDYYAIRLTDTKVIPDVINKLRNYYPKILELRRVGEIQELKVEENKERDLTDPMKLVSDFFTEVTGEKLTSNQQKWVKNALKDVNKK